MKMEGSMAGKRAVLLTLALLMGLLCLTGCGTSGSARYELGLEYLALKEYDMALQEFQALGEYEDAGKFVLYIKALMALEEGELDKAQVDFENLEDFKSSGLYIRYIEARRLEEEACYEEAQEAYHGLGSFRDSIKRMESATAMIPRKAYDAARELMAKGDYSTAREAFLALGAYQDSPRQAEYCQQALLSKEYQAAQGLLKDKDYTGALEAFVALGSYRDSVLQADNCRKSLYETAQAAEQKGDFGKVQEVIALYEALEGYEDAKAKADALRKQYDINLSLRGYQKDYQYISLGTYPQSKTGEKQPILWRVLSVENGTALLLSDKILDVSALEKGETFGGYQNSTLYGFLNGAFLQEAFSDTERTALKTDGVLGKVFLLSKEQVQNPAFGFADDKSRECQSTEYALLKSLHASTTGAGWWWLSTRGTEENCQAIVYYNGMVYGPGLRVADEKTGVRPAVTVNLTQLFLAAGSGTLKDPYKQ